MVVESFARRINKAIVSGDDETAMREIGGAVKRYSEKINEVFVVIPINDIPFMITAIELFRDVLLKKLPEDCIEETLLSVQILKAMCEVSTKEMDHEGPITEAAAKEWYRAMREGGDK